MAALLAFGVIGSEQVLHVGSSSASVAMVVYQALHWISDSLLTLPLAFIAVWFGQLLAARRGVGREGLNEVIGCAALISLVFAALLVPGAALHELVDTLTNAHAVVGTHSHSAHAEGLEALAAFLAHALLDGVVGQLVGCPLVALTLILDWRQ